MIKPSQKELWCEPFECLAGRCGKPMLDDLGRRAIGGHSARVTGARFYTGLGIE